MPEETNKSDNLTKFPNADKANNEASTGLPSAFDLFKPSVEVVKKNLVAYLILMGVPLLLMAIGQGPHAFKPTAGNGNLFANNPLSSLFSLGALAALLASPGLIILQLNGVRNQVIDWQTAFKQGLKQFWRFLGLAILIGVILTVAIFLLVVPFFIILPRVFLAPYFLIDQKLGVMDAIKASNAAYKAHKGVWGVFGVYVLFGLASIVPFIGWLVSNVLGFLYSPASAMRYEQIKLLGQGKAPRTPAEAASAQSATPAA